MGELPVLRACGALARQIGTDAPRAPEVRVIVARFPGESGRAEACHVGLQEAYLLRMTVSAAFARVDQAAALFAHRKGGRMVRRHCADLLLEHASRPDGEQCNR